jgi:hypothetical protein
MISNDKFNIQLYLGLCFWTPTPPQVAVNRSVGATVYAHCHVGAATNPLHVAMGSED